MATLTKYKCRTECPGDVDCFLAHLTTLGVHLTTIETEQARLDGTLTFTSPLSLPILRTLAYQCPREGYDYGTEGNDLHVLYETLQTAEMYTGERVALNLRSGLHTPVTL